MAVQYRRAGLADVPALALLRQASEGGGASEERMARYLAGEHHPQQALAPRAMWMATETHSPIGYVAGHLTQRFKCDGELQWIYVVPAQRGGLVAAALLRLLADWFVRQGAHRVCVDVGNDRARRFYQRHGAQDLNVHWLVWPDISTVLDRRGDGGVSAPLCSG